MKYSIAFASFFLGLLVSNAAAHEESECKPCPPPPTCPQIFVGPPAPCSALVTPTKEQLLQAQKTLELLKDNTDTINTLK